MSDHTKSMIKENANVEKHETNPIDEVDRLLKEIEGQSEEAKQKEQEAREKMAGLDKLSEEFVKAEASLRKALARERLARKASGTGGLG